MKQLPIILTLSRLLATPLLVGAYCLLSTWQSQIMTLIFLLAMLTDFLDGFLARRYQAGSSFGAFLDPIADKILVIVALLLLLNDHLVPLLAVIILICREVVITALREWMAQMGHTHIVSVSLLAKWKTGVQTIAIALLLYRDPLFDINIHLIGIGFLWLATLLSGWSLYYYLQATWQILTKK